MGRHWSGIVVLGLGLTALACEASKPSETKQADDAPAETSSSGVAAPKPSGVPAASMSSDDAKRRCDEGVASLLSTFGGEVKVTLYASRSLPKTTAAMNSVAQLLTRFQTMGKGKLKFTEVDTTTDEAARARAKDAGLQESAFGESDDGSVTSIAQGYFGVVFEYGAEKEVIPVLDPNQSAGLAFWVANKLREIRDRADDKSARLGVVTGKNEIPLNEANLVPPQGSAGGPSIQSIVNQALPFYKLEDVALSSDIDAELRGLIVTQSGQDFTDEELKRIDDFVMRGRRLLVVASAVNLPPWEPKMEATLDLHRLDTLLAGYGIEMRAEVLLDESMMLEIPVEAQDGTQQTMHGPGILKLAHDDALGPTVQVLDNDFVGFFRLEEVMFPFTSPLIPHPEKQPGARLRVVARTSPNAVATSTSPIDLSVRAQAPAPGTKAQHAVAIVMDGTLKSAFGTATSDDAQVLVVSSAQFLANPFARAGNPPPQPPQMQMMGPTGGDRALQALAMPYARNHLTSTILGFKNLLDWMGADERLVACSALLMDKAPPTKDDTKKCTKAQMTKLMDAGMTLDDALEVCAKQK